MSIKDYSVNCFSPLVSRLDFSKVKYPNFTPPDLKGIQISAYAGFIKKELISLISSYFPMYSQSKNTCMYLEEIIFNPPEVTEQQALEEGKSYQYSIYLKIKLVSQQSKNNQQVTEDTIFLGNLPEFTARSNYIINGVEKFIISQIVRSSGAYILPKSQIKLSASKKRVQEGIICELFPIKGSLILFNFLKEQNSKNYIRMTAKNNMGDGIFQCPVTVLLKAFGMSESVIKGFFGDLDYITNTLNKEQYNPKSLILEDSLFLK